LGNGIDETGWRVDAQLRWLWAVVSESVTLCDILSGRGVLALKLIFACAWANRSASPYPKGEAAYRGV